MKFRQIWAGLLLLSLGLGPAHAKWMRFETEAMPIARLLTNLQQRLATNSQSMETLYQLARVHSMAYSTNLAFVPVKKGTAEPMFEHPGSDVGVPRSIFPAPTPPARAEARNHLTNAIAYYRRAHALMFKGATREHSWLAVPIHLGLAWSLDQNAQRREAIETYRDALQLAWQREVDLEFKFRPRSGLRWDRLREGASKSPRNPGHVGPGVCFSEEIISYLLKLLDPKEDAKEIAQLVADRDVVRRSMRAVTPIVVPLTPDTSLSTLVDEKARVAFDLDGSGEQRRWGWITTNAAWLVFDRDGRGQITSGLQMFGNVTFWVFWRNGYAALASLDDDNDGELRGNELRRIALWHDRNSNGVSEAGEVTPAVELGIVALDCRNDVHPSGIPFSQRGATFRDGSARPTYDWIAPSH
jgi:hypothetical protein